MTRIRMIGGTIALGLTCQVFAGCMNPGGTAWASKPSKPGAELPSSAPVSGILRVNKFFPVVPWLIFDNQGSGKIDGFKCAVYLEGPQSAKGVFGTGTFVITLSHIGRDGSGNEIATPVHEWELPPEKAFYYQAREPTMLGWGYGFRLNWGDDVDVSGKKIAIVIKYIRDDGQVISASRQVLRVPLTGDAVRSVS